jgi:hypothetical protein
MGCIRVRAMMIAAWMQQRATAIRDHSAFLNSYASEDEGLYDDAVAR